MRWSTRARWRRRSLASCAGARRPSTSSTKGLHCHAALLPLRSTAAGKAGLHAPDVEHTDMEHTTHHTDADARSTGPLPSAWPVRAPLRARAAFALFHSLARRARCPPRQEGSSGEREYSPPKVLLELRECVFRTGSGSRKLTHVPLPLPPTRPRGDNQPPKVPSALSAYTAYCTQYALVS